MTGLGDGNGYGLHRNLRKRIQGGQFFIVPSDGAVWP